MPTKQVPAMRCLCFPRLPVRRWVASSFGINDNLANLQKGAPARIAEIMAESKVGVQPGQGGHITDVQNLEWWNLFDEEEQLRLTGYTIAPRLQPLNNVIYAEEEEEEPEEEEDDTLPTLPDNVALVWEPQGATARYWQTCLPDREPAASALRFCLCAPEAEACVRTKRPLPPNQHWSAEIQLLGVAPEAEAWLMLRWGQQWCLLWRLNTEAVLGRIRQQGGVLAGPRGQIASEEGAEALGLLPLRRGKFGALWSYQPIRIDVLTVGGRLVVRSANSDEYLCYTQCKRNTPHASAEYEIQPIQFVAAPLEVAASGISFVFRVHEIKYSQGQYTNERYVPTETTGSFRRPFFATRPPKRLAGYASGYVPSLDSKRAEGMSRRECATVSFEDFEEGRGAYRCELECETASIALQPCDWDTRLREYDGEYAMHCENTPLVTAITVDAEPQWRLISSEEPLDIRPALLEATEICADPGLQAGPSWTLRADRNILRELPAPTGGGSVGNDWSRYVGDYNAVRIEVAWIYDDGVQRAYREPNGTPYEWIARFAGYIYGRAVSSEAYNRRLIELELRDETVKLTEPAGIIDGRFCALDFLYLAKMRGASPNRRPRVYGADAVQYILRQALDSNAAANLQVFYPAWSGRWPPPEGTELGIWDLYLYRAFVDPPSGSGFVWPAPFGRDALSWIKDIAELEFSIFWFGPDWDDPTQLAPCYGNYYAYVAGRPITILHDCVINENDVNALVHAVNLQTMPSYDYNRFLVWGRSPAGEDLRGLIPALPAFSGEAVIDDSPLYWQNISYSWPRTLLLQGSHYWLPRVAQRVADNAAYFMRGTRVRRVALKTRGIEWLWWGNRVQVLGGSPTSDPDILPQTLLQQPLTFRVMRITNTWRFDDKPTWEATLNVADMWRSQGGG